jgi:hypothetical protein
VNDAERARLVTQSAGATAESNKAFNNTMIFSMWCDPLQTARQRLEAGLRWRTRLRGKPLGLTALNTTCAVAAPGQRWERARDRYRMGHMPCRYPAFSPSQTRLFSAHPGEAGVEIRAAAVKKPLKKGVIGGRESSNSACVHISASPEGLRSV